MSPANLALAPGVTIEAVPVQPTGSGSRDPAVLLNDDALLLDNRPLADFSYARTYDTYDGPGPDRDLDWYAISLPGPMVVNCVEMTTGFPYRDGGWWTSLQVDVRRAVDEDWETLTPRQILPPLDLRDSRRERRPFATHVIVFDEIVVTAVRLSGRPGGSARFTSLARLGLYDRDLSRWNPASVPPPPVPALYRVISPLTIWNLSDDLVKLTGLSVSTPLMDFYLDDDRFQSFWSRALRGPVESPDLWLLIGEAVGWEALSRQTPGNDIQRMSPHIRAGYLGVLAVAVAPVLVRGEVLAEITTGPVILRDTFDIAAHRRIASEYDIPWEVYRAAMDRTPRMTREQLDGAAGLIGTIAQTIATLVDSLDRLRARDSMASSRRAAVARRAIDYMEDHLEDAVGVAEVARALGLTPSYFATQFAAETGRSPSDVLIGLRLERAKRYLTHTSMTVMEVCVTLGYSPSYFSRLFRRHTGQSPGRFAREQRADQ